MIVHMDIKNPLAAPPASQKLSAFGQLLRHWRQVRTISQLELAAQAETSQRYISFLESGRARPSREMIVRLSDTLDIPLRERNRLFTAARFAPVYPESRLDGPELSAVRDGLELLLSYSDPHATIVVDRCWNLVMGNRATMNLFNEFIDLEETWKEIGHEGEKNILRMLFHPKGLRRFISNWESVAYQTLSRVRREHMNMGGDARAEMILEEIAQYEGFPKGWIVPDWSEALPLPVAPFELEKHGLKLVFHTLIDTFGTPQDVTLQELRVETFLPSDGATAAYMKALSARGAGAAVEEC